MWQESFKLSYLIPRTGDMKDEAALLEVKQDTTGIFKYLNAVGCLVVVPQW